MLCCGLPFQKMIKASHGHTDIHIHKLRVLSPAAQHHAQTRAARTSSCLAPPSSHRPPSAIHPRARTFARAALQSLNFFSFTQLRMVKFIAVFLVTRTSSYTRASGRATILRKWFPRPRRHACRGPLEAPNSAAPRPAAAPPRARGPKPRRQHLASCQPPRVECCRGPAGDARCPPPANFHRAARAAPLRPGHRHRPARSPLAPLRKHPREEKRTFTRARVRAMSTFNGFGGSRCFSSHHRHHTRPPGLKNLVGEERTWHHVTCECDPWAKSYVRGLPLDNRGLLLSVSVPAIPIPPSSDRMRLAESPVGKRGQGVICDIARVYRISHIADQRSSSAIRPYYRRRLHPHTRTNTSTSTSTRPHATPDRTPHARGLARGPDASVAVWCGVV
jgi:hypothetical protein